MADGLAVASAEMAWALLLSCHPPAYPHGTSRGLRENKNALSLWTPGLGLGTLSLVRHILVSHHKSELQPRTQQGRGQGAYGEGWGEEETDSAL